MIANKREMKKIGTWLIDGNTGLSSKAMAAVWLGGSSSRIYAPSDPSDFKRCIQFLEQCIDPSNRGTLVMQMAEFTTDWKNIMQNWLKLVELYEEERDQDRAPKLYGLMKSIGL